MSTAEGFLPDTDTECPAIADRSPVNRPAASYCENYAALAEHHRSRDGIYFVVRSVNIENAGQRPP